MDQLQVSRFSDFHSIVADHRPQNGWFFRGQSNPSWSLIPKIGRPPFIGVRERTILDSWKRWAIQYLVQPPKNDWEWLIIAQHHGLATRLLDWTRNPLNAAYFAVRKPIDEDAVVYAARAVRFSSVWDLDNEDPLQLERVAVIYPPAIVQRIVRQHGLFTIHPSPQEVLSASTGDVSQVTKIIIDASYRRLFASELASYGVHAANLFPDLDGLATFFNWCIESGEFVARTEVASGVVEDELHLA
jgi:hypothetical protein